MPHIIDTTLLWLETADMTIKKNIDNLAFFGGDKLFDRPRSTSNLVRPDIDKFLEYSKIFYMAGQYSNNGPLVKMLEKRLAEFHETDYCVSFCSGFWALVLGMKALAIEGRSEVVMPSLTYRRLADAVAWAGLVPHFCDVDIKTLAISPETAEPHINENTALIIGVHPIINCCDVSGLEILSKHSGIPLLVDGVESVNETVEGRKVGSFGLGECFSLHASKLLNGFEGGYLTTNDQDVANRLRNMRGFGFTGQDIVVGIGTNAKLNEVHAAMALASLDGLNEQISENLRRYRVYQEVFNCFDGMRLINFDETTNCGYKNIVVELTEKWVLPRALTIALLNAEGILARAYYSPPLHMKTTTYPVVSSQLPVTEYLAERFIIMPSGYFVGEKDIRDIVDFIFFIDEHATAILKRVENEY